MLVRGDAIEPHSHELEPHLSCRIQCSARSLIGLRELKMESEQCHGASPALGSSNPHAKPNAEKGAFDLHPKTPKCVKYSSVEDFETMLSF
jgi:hypothetical protein